MLVADQKNYWYEKVITNYNTAHFILLNLTNDINQDSIE